MLRLVGRVLMTIFSLVLMTGLRLYLFGIPHIGGYGGQSSRITFSPSASSHMQLSVPTDHSNWIVFSSNDPQTGASVRHARLAAETTGGVPGKRPGGLEFLEGSQTGMHAQLWLNDAGACQKVTSLTAAFDTRAAAQFAVSPVPAAEGCRMEITDYTAFLLSVRDSNVLRLQPAPASSADGGLLFSVAGLSWD